MNVYCEIFSENNLSLGAVPEGHLFLPTPPSHHTSPIPHSDVSARAAGVTCHARCPDRLNGNERLDRITVCRNGPPLAGPVGCALPHARLRTCPGRRPLEIVTSNVPGMGTESERMGQMANRPATFSLIEIEASDGDSR